MQSGMSESTSKVVEIQEVAAEDMKIILDFIYGVLDNLPEERLQTLVLAADRLQVKQLMERYVTQLELRLTMDSLAETAVLADRLHHDELHNALVIFAQQEETRSDPARHEALMKPALTDSPDFAYKLLKDMQSALKKTRKE
ncbi:g10014 [Coccomyxa viridis]|uniref:G10014 protein n=1 Tax=Coccomyxa viridis TaxID=1274662 RepID=A0ABP1G5Q0_9CHLO